MNEIRYSNNSAEDSGERIPGEGVIANGTPAPQPGVANGAAQVRRSLASFRSAFVRWWSPTPPGPTVPAQNPSAVAESAEQKQLNGGSPAELESPPIPLTRLAIKSNGRVIFVKTDDIDWIGAADNYVDLHVGARSHLLREKLSAMESRLASEKFVRISRSTIVNLERVKELQSLPRGAYAVILQDGARLKLCRNYRDKLKQFGLR